MSWDSIMEDEIVNFPVPKRLLPVVIQALAKAMEPAVAVPEGTEQGAKPAQTVPALTDWTDVSNMKRLREGLTLPIGLKLLDMTAARPGEMIPFKEVYTAAGFTETRRAGSSLGSLTKVIKREFGVPFEEAVWPVEHHWAVNNDAQYSYSMSPQVAQAWLQSAA